MISVPKEKPSIENLNSYYLDIRKLIEHYQGHLGVGCIHFKAPGLEGAIFFDQDAVLAGVFDRDGIRFQGVSAIDDLIDAVNGNNFSVDIYPVAPDEIYFWVGISQAEELYKNLSTEFTDLGALIKKMKSEKFTGYIDVTIAGGEESGIVFFHNGNIAGGSFSWEAANGIPENIQVLYRKTKQSGGVLHVGRITVADKATKAPKENSSDQFLPDAMASLEELLNIFEDILSHKKRVKADFETLLKRKFIQKANKYAFLDPFVAEFKYSNRKIMFVGEAGGKDLCLGVIEAARELSEDLGIFPQLTEALGGWSEKNRKMLGQFGIRF